MADNKKFEVNIMMFGGRRSGKTSVLAAMKECVDKTFNNEASLGFTIASADDETAVKLIEKSQEIKGYYDLPEEERKNPITPDNSPTFDKQEYKFNISLIDKPSAKLQINFVDYPGEWLDNSTQYGQLKEIMEKTDIIIIAIDTPYLMEASKTEEAVGKYNESKNFSARVAEMVKNNFVVSENTQRKKMVLFVPLKCERYHNASNPSKDEMELVNQKIHKAFENLIAFVTQGENANRYECAITPIFTIGNLRFTRFQEDENGDFIMYEGKYPAKPMFRFDDNAIEPEPEYCEQPLLYTLLFLFKWAEQSKTRKGLGRLLTPFDTLASRFLKIPGAEDFAARSEYLRSKLEKESDGYEILSDPLGFKGV